MARALTESVALFLLPFAVFAGWLAWRQHHPFTVDPWTGKVVGSLGLAGLALAVLGILIFGFFEARPTGAYVPAHVENGRVVPGHFE